MNPWHEDHDFCVLCKKTKYPHSYGGLCCYCNKQKKHKFGAKRCEVDGKKFPSKLEGQMYLQLKMRQHAGDVLFFLRQIPFDLPGDITYRLDFMIFLSNGEIEFIETKGHMTADAKIKIAQTEEIYGIKIKIVERI